MFIFQESYDSRDSPMYTTLETPGSVASYSGLPLACPTSPGKYYPSPGPAPPYSPGYQYSAYSRPPAPGYSTDVLSGLYPGYSSQFSYEALGQHPSGLYDNSSSMGKGLSNYGGIYVPSAAAASTALPSK